MNSAPVALSLASDPGVDFAARVAAAKSGDQAAFARVVEQAGATVASIALAIVRDVARSEEVAQDVLIAAWHGLPRLRDPNSFWPWLRQLTRNRARQHLRDVARLRRRGFAGDDDALARVVDVAARPDQHLVSAEEEAALAAALEALPDDARELTVLFYREGQSLRQVADLLGISEASARKRLQRARDEVRAGVLERLGEIARKTTPGATFTAAVLAGLASSVPSTAAAAGLGLGAKLGGGKWLPALGAALPGFLFAAAAIVLPMRKVMKDALDAEERRKLRIVVLSALVVTAMFMVGVQVAISTERPAIMVAGYVVMQLGFIGLYGIWLPQIVRRRQAFELAQDPGAARRHRRERRWSLFGLAMGTICGAGGVLGALHFFP